MWEWLATNRGSHTLLEIHGKDGTQRDFTYADINA